MDIIHENYFNPSLKFLINDYVLLFNYTDLNIQDFFAKIIDIDQTDQYLCSTNGIRDIWLSEDLIVRLLTPEEIIIYQSLKN